jgi:hypothetical protein
MVVPINQVKCFGSGLAENAGGVPESAVLPSKGIKFEARKREIKLNGDCSEGLL